MSEEQSNQVITKKNEGCVAAGKKNEGRVAAGKRLAEWNHKNKADLQKNLGKSTSQEGQEPIASPHKFPDSAYYGAGGLAVVLAVCVAVYYIRGSAEHSSKKPAETVSTGAPADRLAAQQEQGRHINIFKMR